MIRSLFRKDVLKHLVLIGSWVLAVYRKHYPFGDFELVTRDIDFLVKNPRGPFPKGGGNIFEILQERGYKVLHSPGSKAEKYIPDKSRTDNELDVEFLCQPGRHIQDACRIKELGIIAQPIQYQGVLLDDIITLEYEGIGIDVPDPLVWAIHKIAISQERSGVNKGWKSVNDLNVAGLIVQKLGEENVLRRVGQYKGKFLKLFRKGWAEYGKRK